MFCSLILFLTTASSFVVTSHVIDHQSSLFLKASFLIAGDYDQDGKNDIVALTNQGIRLYINNGGGESFTSYIIDNDNKALQIFAIDVRWKVKFQSLTVNILYSIIF